MRLIVNQLEILLLHLPHPDLFHRVTKKHELVRVRGGHVRRIESAILSAELNVLPTLRMQLLQTGVQIIVAFIHLKKGQKRIADCNTEGNGPRDPIYSSLLASCYLDRQKGRNNQRSNGYNNATGIEKG